MATASTTNRAREQTTSDAELICIRGARVHNLRNVDVEIPRERLVVVTGLSGSGKSSLAFDTLYAEGQRQYIESLSVYARQFLHQLERPDVDLIEGLQPTICIDQRIGSQNPRSTVATVTEIYDYLRLLFARVGHAHCYECGEPIEQMPPGQIQEDLLALPEGTKLMILAPSVRGRKGKHREVFAEIRKAGFVRARVDGQVYELDHLPELEPRRVHTIEAVVDRIIIRKGAESRVAESVQLAVKHGEGLLLASILNPDAKDRRASDAWTDRLYSTQYACPRCKISLPELEPRSFSFNSPYGACPRCDGLGRVTEFDSELVIPDLSLSPAEGAVAPWRKLSAKRLKRIEEELAPFIRRHDVDWETPLEKLSPEQREELWLGDGEEFFGVLLMLEKQYVTASREKERQRLEAYRAAMPCPECGGARLRAEARACRLGGAAIHEIAAMSIEQASAFFAGLELGETEQIIARPLVAEIANRLKFLAHVGADYLSLDRPANSLSGGEAQRVRLATGIGSGLVGVCYILDEPSIGLHPRDNDRLIGALRELQEQGNTVIVVEHDQAMMEAADWLIDVGPGAGEHGGRIVAEGTLHEIRSQPESITGRYLAREMQIPIPAERRRVAKTRSLEIDGVATNNLQEIDVRIPLGVLVCVTGVSGSGKSSLVGGTLVPAIGRRLGSSSRRAGPYRSLRGAAALDRLVQIDQSPIGRTPRSNPATYSGLFDEIRKVFAGTKAAKQFGYKAGRFSFNTKGGRCEACQGQGLEKIEMNFLPDLYVTCSECGGKRFNHQTLLVRYRGRSIADVLDMRIEEALEFFENFPAMRRLLDSLNRVGLGYLPLGQPSTTLSGGEAQRVKLATELGRAATGKTLYVLDEPTTGLHFDDVRRLLEVLGGLADAGNAVLVVEHNLEVIKTADWILDLGPGGGEHGGTLVAEGTPEDVAAVAESSTGQFLSKVLKTQGKKHPEG